MSRKTSKTTGEVTLSDLDSEDSITLPVSATVLQSVYHDLTLRTETNSRKVNGDFDISAEDIADLIHRLRQYSESMNAQAWNENITVSHYKSNVLQFSSLERFEIYDRKISTPTEEVVVEFGFLTQTGKKKAVDTKFLLTIRSYVAIKNDVDMRFRLGGVSEYGGTPVLKMDIEYVDYVIAKSLESLFDDWVSSLDRRKYFRVKRVENILAIEHLDKFFAALASSCFSLSAYNFYFSDIDGGLFYSLITLLLSLSLFLLIFNNSFWRVTLRGYFPFTIMNVGDERNYAYFIKVHRRVSKLFWVFVGTGVLGFLSSILAAIVTSFWLN